MPSNPNIAWVDCETSGLDAETCNLLEIAVVVTDSELNELENGRFHAVVKYDPIDVLAMRSSVADVVYDMHLKTALWDRLTGRQALPLAAIDVTLAEFLATFGERCTMPVGGSSVRLDMNFIDKHLPLTSGFLDYHMRDVSSLAGFMSDWFGLPYFEKDPSGWHTAEHDVTQSLLEAQYIRQWATPAQWKLAMMGEGSNGVNQNQAWTTAKTVIEGAVSGNSDVVALTPWSARRLWNAYVAEQARIRHEAEGWDRQLKDAEKRDSLIAEVVASGVPRAQALDFVFANEQPEVSE